MTYWINTVSADHVQRGVAGGFAQANHGKPDMLRKMSRDDWVIFYSPKTAFEKGEPLRRSPPSAGSSTTSPTRFRCRRSSTRGGAT